MSRRSTLTPPGAAASPSRKRRALLSLGSNLGDREDYLRQAREKIRSRFPILRETSELDNPAVILVQQPDFLNQILEIETDLPPLELLRFLQAVEIDLGRRHRERYGPREIDLDILDFEGEMVETEVLTLPHPGLKDRAYLHRLLAELNRIPAAERPR